MVLEKWVAIFDWEWAEIWPLEKARKSPVLYMYQFVGFKVIAIRAALNTNFEVLDLRIDF